MTIYTNSLVVTGSLGNNGLSGMSNAPLSVKSDIMVEGSVMAKGRFDVGTTMYMTMRASSNIPMQGNEHFVTGGDMTLDDANSDVAALASFVDNVSGIWDPQTGIYTVPLDGLYTVQMQGSFSNSVPESKNGVYMYLANSAYPTSRMAATVCDHEITYTSYSSYMHTGDKIKPTFFSTDSNAVLLGNGETFLNFTVASTFTRA